MDQEIRLVHSQIGAEGVAKARAEYQALKTQIADTSAAFGRGEISAVQLEKTTRALGKELDQLGGFLKRLDDDAEAQAAALAKGTDATRAWASAVTGASSAGSAWGAVTRNAGEAAAEATRKIEQEALAARNLAKAEEAATAATRSMVITTDQVAAGHARVGASADKVGSKVAGVGQSFLQTGRVVQDFTQAGIPGILNNIEGLSMALGGGPGLAGILTVVGVAAYIAKPYAEQFFNTLTGGSNKVPEAATNLGRLEEHLKATGKELDALKEKTSLSNSELARFNELTETQIGLETRLNAARNVEKVKATPNVEQAERAAEIGKMQKEFGGANFVNDVRQIIKENAPKGSISPDDLERQTTALVDNLSRGFASAKEGLQAMVFKGAGAKTDVGKAVLAGMTPGEQTDVMMKAKQEEVKRAEEHAKDVEAKKKAENDRIKELNAEGQTIADEGRKQAQEQEKKDVADRAKLNAEQHEEARKRFNKQADEVVKGAEATPLDEHATARASEMQAAGMNETQAFIRLATELEARLKAMSPGEDPDVIRAAAGKSAEAALDRAKGGAKEQLFGVQQQFPGVDPREAMTEAVRRQAIVSAQAAARSGPLPVVGRQPPPARRPAAKGKAVRVKAPAAARGPAPFVPRPKGPAPGPAVKIHILEAERNGPRDPVDPAFQQSQPKAKPVPFGPSNERMSTPAVDLSPVAHANDASLQRDQAAQGAAGAMLQTMAALAAQANANGQQAAGWGQVERAAIQIRGNIKMPGRR